MKQSVLLKWIQKLCVVFLITYSSIANANNGMRPLSEALEQETSPSMMVYAFERCSGLFASLYARFNNYNDPKYKQIAAIHLQNASTMSLAALVFAKKAGLNLTQQRTTEKSLSIAKRYGNIMNDEYERTGNSISNFIEADLSLCMSLVKLVNKK